MNCDKIFTKHIKYNSPVLYELELLKKDVEKLKTTDIQKFNELNERIDNLTLSVQNNSQSINVINAEITEIQRQIQEIISASFDIEKMDYESEDGMFVYADNKAEFNGSLTYQLTGGEEKEIDSSLKFGIKGSDSVIVDADENNDGIIIDLDETQKLNYVDLGTTEETTGILSDADFIKIRSNLSSYILLNDEKFYYKNNKGSYITFMTEDLPTNTEVTYKALYVNIDSTAVNYKHWSVEYVNSSVVIDEEPTEDSSNAVSSGGVYDALINRMQTETIYDKDSIDPNINWEYTGGIKPTSQGGTTITGKDFSKYKKIYIDFINSSTSNANSACGTVVIDLTHQSNTSYGYVGVTISSNLYHGFMGVGGSSESYQKYAVQVDTGKTSITFRSVSFNFNSMESVIYDRCQFYKIRGEFYG